MTTAGHARHGRPHPLALRPAKPCARIPAKRWTPDANILQAALRTTTEHLAQEIAAPSVAAPAWSGLEWRMARAAAAIHGISAMLSARLRWAGPAGWEGFLYEQRTYTLQREQERLELLDTLSLALEEAGVAAVALQGAALQGMGLYSGGERPLDGLDILIQDRNLEPAAELLRRLGLAAVPGSQERSFAGPSQAPRDALGEHPGHALKVQLHTRLSEPLPLYPIDITRHVFPADAQPGLNAYPSLAVLMADLLLHAAGCMVNRSLRALHLHDLALLAARMDESAWSELLELRTASSPRGAPWWALPPLQMAARYYPGVLPEPVARELASRCRLPLRLLCARQQLSDVSHTRLWADTCPGFEWARSPAELLAYIYGRIRPGQATVLARTQARATLDWAAYNAWARLSQNRRMLDKLVQRPTRPQAMQSVLAALATGP